MRGISLEALLVAVGLVAGCEPALGMKRAEIREEFRITLKAEGALQMRVNSGVGRIRLRRGDDGQVTITGDLRIRARDEEEGKHLAQAIKENPPVVQNGNRIEIGDLSRYRQQFPRLGNSSRLSLSLNYDIQVPYNTEAELNSGLGDVQISGIRGPLQVNTGTGDVEIDQVHETIKVDTGLGNVRVTGSAAVTVKTGSGKVSLTRISGDVNVNTGLGEVSLKDIGGSLTLETGTGGIQIDSPIPDNAKWDVQTGLGDVTIALPANARFTFLAETGIGRITTEFPLLVTGRLSSKKLQGTVGEKPSSELYIRTKTGDIHLRKL